MLCASHRQTQGYSHCNLRNQRVQFGEEGITKSGRNKSSKCTVLKLQLAVLKVGPGIMLGKHMSGYLPRLHLTDNWSFAENSLELQSNPCRKSCPPGP
jgi:hypothetical protein